MVIGSGLLAGAFMHLKIDNIIIFASGVSNSKCVDDREFLREQVLLEETLKIGLPIIYFSTCSIYDSSLTNSPYILHKQSMENLIRKRQNKYLIFRLPNVVGKSENPNTMLNFFYHSLIARRKIIVHRCATRYLIHVSDVSRIVTQIITSGCINNQIINLVYPRLFKVVEIIEAFERHSDTKFDIELVDTGSSYEVDLTSLQNLGIEVENKTQMKNLDEMIRDTYFQ